MLTSLTSMPLKKKHFALFTFIFTAFISGCNDNNDNAEEDVSQAEAINLGGDGDIFAADRLLDVQITLEENDYQQLKAEGRTLASTARTCVPDYEYTEFTGKVSIDGTEISDVIVRKKGFMGSLSPSRPSIKLDFDDLWDDRTYQNVSRMTLNNNRQDASNVRQCMAYDLFRAKGIAAPRCNFAKVTVNGEALGIYTNVEPIKKPFLKRTFGDDDGNLYESSIADFGQYLGDRFEKKTNKKEDDRSDLQAVADAMDLSDDQFKTVMPQLIDLDEFIQFWAIETVLGFWDSATGNANNFYIYKNPEDDLFHFIPWGADTAFTGDHLLKPGSGPLFRNFRLADKLFTIEEYRQQYFDAINALLNNEWNETTMEAEIKRIGELTGTSDDALAVIQDYINYARSELVDALNRQEHDEKVSLLEDEPTNCQEITTTTLSADIKTDAGNDTGAFQFTLTNGHNVNASIGLAALSVDSIVYDKSELTNPGVVSLLIIGADVNAGFKPYVIQLFIEAPDYVPGEYPLHGFANNVMIFEVIDAETKAVKLLALGETGTIKVNQAGTGESGSDIDISLEITLEHSPE